MGLTSYPLHVVFPSLAQLLTRRVHGCNKDRHLVQGDIVGWIEKLLYSSDPRVRRWRGVVANLSRSVSQFHKLPLFLAHPSISATTALVNDNCEDETQVRTPAGAFLPLGMGLADILTLSRQIYRDDEGNTCVEIQREFFSAEHLFWDSLFRSMDPFSRAEALRHIDLVQDAVRLATLLEHFPIDSEGNPQPTFDFMMQYLPFFLSYRIPLGRGTSEDAFDDALEERVENWLIYRCRDG
ncbi:hypothetical protein ACHAQA_006822 [Verticillium albo-atrum]